MTADATPVDPRRGAWLRAPGARPRDTIVALATASGPAALATVRVTGPETRRLLDAVLRGPGARFQPIDRRATVARLVDPGDEAAIDEIVVTFFAGPNSYTGEDLAELSLHGGPWLVAEALRILVSLGARIARAGEFTRRAVIAGKLDLARAEAVAELSLAQSGAAAKLAVRHLSGELSSQFDRLRDELITVVALLEGPLEFPDDAQEDEMGALGEARRRIELLGANLRRLTDSHVTGARITNGTEVPLVGRPNVGKSSLFNALLGSDRAIVSPHSGTTRDSIEALLVLGGHLVRLVDTAGFGIARDELDAEAMRRTATRIDSADVVVLVLDRSAPLTDGDAQLVRRIGPKPLIVAAMKSDLAAHWSPPALARLGLEPRAVAVSAVDSVGLSDLRDDLQRVTCGADIVGPGERGAVTSVRQCGLLDRASDELSRAQLNLALGAIELAVEDVHAAREALTEIVGESCSDEVLDQVFERFCIGK